MSKHAVDQLEIRSLEVKDAGGVTRETINSEGFKQVRYEDEYPSGIWGDGTGAASPTYSNFTIGGIALRKLVLDANDAIANMFEVPHGMAYPVVEGVQPEMHVHFRPTTVATGTVKFFLQLEWSKANEPGYETLVLPEALPEMTATYDITTGSAAYPHALKAFGVIPVHAYGLGDIISFRLERRTGEGTYTDSVIVEKVAMHVPVDDRGSRQMYVK